MSRHWGQELFLDDGKTAEQNRGVKNCAGQPVLKEGDGRDVASRQAREGHRIESIESPDGEVRDDKEKSCRRQRRSGHAQRRLFLPEHESHADDHGERAVDDRHLAVKADQDVT